MTQSVHLVDDVVVRGRGRRLRSVRGVRALDAAVGESDASGSGAGVRPTKHVLSGGAYPVLAGPPRHAHA